mmetsp:Transcript_75388/g.243895  ORF Transcript_75388/g.243895 Transcript_75388/m.243895 type:complete len:228 (-) Transcript_75388:228-911(-)
MVVDAQSRRVLRSGADLGSVTTRNIAPQGRLRFQFDPCLLVQRHGHRLPPGHGVEEGGAPVLRPEEVDVRLRACGLEFHFLLMVGGTAGRAPRVAWRGRPAVPAAQELPHEGRVVPELHDIPADSSTSPLPRWLKLIPLLQGHSRDGWRRRARGGGRLAAIPRRARCSALPSERSRGPVGRRRASRCSVTRAVCRGMLPKCRGCPRAVCALRGSALRLAVPLSPWTA